MKNKKSRDTDMETKEEYLKREDAWIATLPGATADQAARIFAWITAERLAHGLADGP